MALDWVPIRHDLQDDPRVIRVSREMSALLSAESAHPARIVGALARLWSLVDRRADVDFVEGATLEWVDHVTELPGFGKVLAECTGTDDSHPWVVVESNGLRFPDLDRYISKTAKRRAKEAKRKAQYDYDPRNSRAKSAQIRAGALPNTTQHKEENPPNPPSGEGGNRGDARRVGAERRPGTPPNRSSRAERKRLEAERAIREHNEWLARQAESERIRAALAAGATPKAGQPANTIPPNLGETAAPLNATDPARGDGRPKAPNASNAEKRGNEKPGDGR